MDQERRSLHIGLAVILCAVAFRLVGGSILRPVAGMAESKDAVSMLLYLETGRVVREEEALPTEPDPQPTVPPETLPEVPAPYTFQEEDADRVSIKTAASFDLDVDELLGEPLFWELRAETPTVLIIHTHTTESYTAAEGEDYKETSDYRTLSEDYNMIAIGRELARNLEAAGIGVIHDTTFHDYPEYNGAYGRSRTTVSQQLREHPGILLVLDLHRDASDGANGKQLNTSAAVNGAPSAQLMLVVGTDAGGLKHPTWEKNLALAVKLHAALDTLHPGVCRPLRLRTERFNQDLLPGMLLVEVGGAGDSRQEALNAARALADGIIALADGAIISSAG